MKLDLIRALKQPITGNSWPVNLLIGAVISIVGAIAAGFQPIGGLVQMVATIFTAGYAVNVIQNALSSTRNQALPDWIKDWQSIGIQGMNGYFGIWAWSMIAGFVGGLLEPRFAIYLMGGGMAVVIGLLLLKAVLVMGLALLIVHYAATSNIMAFIQLNVILDRIAANPLGAVVAIVATMVVLYVSTLTLLIPVVGVFAYAVAHFASYLVIANLWAQVYRG